MIGKFDFHFLLLFRIIKPDKIPGIPDILSGYNIYGYCPPMSITDYKGNITESQRLKIEQCAINILYYRSFPICKGSESRFFFENATEITRVIESHICGNLSNRQIFIFKLSLCLFYALSLRKFSSINFRAISIVFPEASNSPAFSVLFISLNMYIRSVLEIFCAISI